MSMKIPDGAWVCAFTLTTSSFPSALKFAALRRAWEKRVRRDRKKGRPNFGVDGVCWLREWQQSGRPHYHGILVWNNPPTAMQAWRAITRIPGVWVDVCRRAGCGADVRFQRVESMQNENRWLSYCMKHFVRAAHYQRQPERRYDPTGRVWGHSGLGMTDQLALPLTDREGYQLRRIFRRLARSRRALSVRGKQARVHAVSVRQRRRDGERVSSQFCDCTSGLANKKVSRWLGRTAAFFTPESFYRLLASISGTDWARTIPLSVLRPYLTHYQHLAWAVHPKNRETHPGLTFRMIHNHRAASGTLPQLPEFAFSGA